LQLGLAWLHDRPEVVPGHAFFRHHAFGNFVVGQLGVFHILRCITLRNGRGTGEDELGYGLLQTGNHLAQILLIDLRRKVLMAAVYTEPPIMRTRDRLGSSIMATTSGGVGVWADKTNEDGQN
jgi:hypothetical protein